MYKVDEKKKIVIIKAGSLNEKEEKEIKDYINYGGYTSQIVKEMKRTDASERTAKIGDKDILEILKDDEQAIARYEEEKEQPSIDKKTGVEKRDKNGNIRKRGFLGGKQWFIENYEKEYIAFLKKTKQTAALKAFEKRKK